MKHKFSSMGRVAIALVLALSLSLVMAVPVYATHTLTPGASVDIDADTNGGVYTALNNIVFTDLPGTDLAATNTFYLTAPTGFEFNPVAAADQAQGADYGTLQIDLGGGAGIAQAPAYSVTDTVATWTVTAAGTGTIGNITISGMEIRPKAGKTEVVGDGIAMITIEGNVTIFDSPNAHPIRHIPGALAQFAVVPVPLDPVVGEPSTVTITAQDQHNNDITLYPGENLDLNQANADEPANLTWSGADVVNDGDGTGRFIGSWASGACTVNVSYTKANDPVTLAVTGETTGKVGQSAPVTWGPVAILTIVGTAYQNGNDTIVIGFNTEVQPADELPWDADVFTLIKHGTTSVSLVGASFNPASGLTTTLTITLDETNAYLVYGDAMKVTPALEAIKDAAGNFVPIDEITGDTVDGDTVLPNFTIAYYTDAGLTSPLDSDYMKEGTYYIKITASEALSATPTISIGAEGTANDVTDEATTAVAGSTKVFQYTRTILFDAAAVGTTPEAITITGTDLAGNVAPNANVTGEKKTDTEVPTIAVNAVVGLTSGAADTITVTFSEDVAATDGDFEDGNEVAGITLKKSGQADVSVDLTHATFAYAPNDLTITLAETGNAQDYLINTYTVTFDPSNTNTIEDGAVNLLAVTAIVGTTVVSGDSSVPTMSTVVGTIQTGDDTITITFSEKVRPADGTWSANEFTIKSPDNAPLNINHASFAIDASNTVLTITLNEATDGAFLVIGDEVKVYKVTGAVLDLAGNALVADKVGDTIVDPALPTIVSIVGTTIEDAGDTIVITFSEAVTLTETTPVWSTNEFDNIQSPDGSGLTLTTATFSIDGTNTVLTVTLDEATDGEYLVNGDTLSATPADGKIEDADSNSVANTKVVGATVVADDVALPTITSIIGTVIPGIGATEKDIIRIDFSEAVRPDDGTWGASTDEFVITNADLSGTPTFSLDATRTVLTITLDTNKNLVAGQTLTVTPQENKVRDLAGNAMDFEVDVPSAQPVNESYAIDLVAGWNLISLPLVPDSSVITDVLSGLIAAGTVDEVRTYDQGVWSNWASTGPAGDLTIMKDGSSYWIEMNAADVLVVTGVEIPAPPSGPKSYDVYIGWNMTGFKSLISKVANAYLGTAIEATVEMMYGYDAASSVYTLLDITTNDLDPGAGYWLAVSADGTIYP